VPKNKKTENAGLSLALPRQAGRIVQCPPSHFVMQRHGSSFRFKKLMPKTPANGNMDLPFLRQISNEHHNEQPKPDSECFISKLLKFCAELKYKIR
jgi:hypothetical protein